MPDSARLIWPVQVFGAGRYGLQIDLAAVPSMAGFRRFGLLAQQSADVNSFGLAFSLSASVRALECHKRVGLVIPIRFRQL
jgi:hypothetical protein